MYKSRTIWLLFAQSLIMVLNYRSSLTPFTDIVLIISLYLMIKGGGKDEGGRIGINEVF